MTSGTGGARSNVAESRCLGRRSRPGVARCEAGSSVIRPVWCPLPGAQPPSTQRSPSRFLTYPPDLVVARIPPCFPRDIATGGASTPRTHRHPPRGTPEPPGGSAHEVAAFCQFGRGCPFLYSGGSNAEKNANTSGRRVACCLGLGPGAPGGFSAEYGSGEHTCLRHGGRLCRTYLGSKWGASLRRTERSLRQPELRSPGGLPLS